VVSDNLALMRSSRYVLELMGRLTRRRYADLSPSDLMALGPGPLAALRRFVEDVDQELHRANCLQLRALAEEVPASTEVRTP